MQVQGVYPIIQMFPSFCKLKTFFKNITNIKAM